MGRSWLRVSLSSWGLATSLRALAHGQGRTGRAARGSLAGISARLLTAAASIVTVPILLAYLGLDGYGIWVACWAFMVWVSLGQIGLRQSAIDGLAKLDRGDAVARATLTSTAWWLSVLLALVSVTVLVLLDLADAWGALYNVSSTSLVADARAVTVIVWLGTAVSMPAYIPQSVLAADQQVHLVALVVAAGTIIRTAALVIAVFLDLSIAWLAGLSTIGWLAPLLVAAAGVFGRRVSWPRRSMVDCAVARTLLRTGLGFMGIGVAAAVVTSTDVLVITQLLGPAAVAPYSVAFALLLLFMGVVAAVLEAVWPAYAEASRSDRRWIDRANRTITRALLGASIVFAGFLIVFGKAVIQVWAGAEAVPPQGLLYAFASIAVVYAVLMSHVWVLIALGGVRRATSLSLVGAAINVPISIVLGYGFGITGVALGTLVAYLATGWLAVGAARKAMRQTMPASVAGRDMHMASGPPDVMR
jgi:O-antigen/teichoic acid export membrane protein